MDFSYVSHWRLVRQHDISGSRNHEQSYGAAITTINRKKPWLQLLNIDPEISDAASHNIMLGVVFRWYQGTFGRNLFDGENHGFAVFFNQSSEKFLTWQDLALSWAPRQKLKGFRRTRHDHQHVLLLLVQFWGCQPRSPRRIITSLIKTYNTWCMKTKTNLGFGGEPVPDDPQKYIRLGYDLNMPIPAQRLADGYAVSQMRCHMLRITIQNKPLCKPPDITVPLWLFNIAMEKGPFTDDFPLKPPFIMDFP